MLALTQFMLVLDVTVVNVALPTIQHDLGFERSSLAWVVDGYTLTAGGLLLLGGRLADLIGRRRMFFAGVAVFAVASGLSGAAQTPGMLIASRFAQGCGEALAGPAAFGLIALLFPSGPQRVKAVDTRSGRRAWPERRGSSRPSSERRRSPMSLSRASRSPLQRVIWGSASRRWRSG